MNEDIETVCNECGQKYAGGELYYRSLNIYDDEPEPYCVVCESDDLTFLPPREK